MALVGDTGKFVTRGGKRISRFSDNGLLRATVAFAAGETNVTLSGCAPVNPRVTALSGTTSNPAYNSVSHVFTVNVSPGPAGTASVGLSLAPLPSLRAAPVGIGQIQISWPVTAVGCVLEQAANLTPPVVWSPIPDPVTATNGWHVVTITNVDAAAFYRLISL